MPGSAPAAERLSIPPFWPTGQGTSISFWVDIGLNYIWIKEQKGGMTSPFFIA
jgi:hypothetical protein